LDATSHREDSAGSSDTQSLSSILMFIPNCWDERKGRIKKGTLISQLGDRAAPGEMRPCAANPGVAVLQKSARADHLELRADYIRNLQGAGPPPEDTVKTDAAITGKAQPVILRNALFLLGYALAYGALLFCAHRFEGFELGEPLLVLGLMGGGFSALAWWVTRNAVPLPCTVKQPAREVVLLLLYILPLVVYLTWGRNALHLERIPEPGQSLIILAIKLLLVVAIPAVMIRFAGGYQWRELFEFRGAGRHFWPAFWMCVAIIALQCVLGSGLTAIHQSAFARSTLVMAAPLLYLFLLVEVGLVEEFFCRVLLQTRLAAWLKSEVGGLVGMSLIFGLMHAPGLYYRSAATQEAVGAHPSWLMAIGYSIVITSVAGFFLGVLWIRTRNLLLLMAVHAAGDLVPNFVPMLKNWL